MTQAPDLRIPGIPEPLHWVREPAAWTLDDEGLQITAPPGGEVFTDPATGIRIATAPALLVDLAGLERYQLSARVTVDFASTYDAGVLLLWAGPDRFAKFCFEFSPQGQPMAVSVVTRDVSDDANGFTVDGRSLWMRIARLDRTFAFHASLDGTQWAFVRHFDLGSADPPQIGFVAQSPTGQGCTVRFSDIRFSAEGLADLRDGT